MSDQNNKALSNKLKTLSREEKMKLMELIEERARRDKLKIRSYEPNPGQVQVHKCQKKIRLVVAGNGSGKSTLGANEAVWAAQGYNPLSEEYLRVPRRVVVVLDKPDKVSDKWIPEMRKWFNTENWSFNKNGKPYVSQIAMPNGSEIKFMFHEQDELSFESLEVDDLIFDEPPPRHIYIALIRGMRNKDKAARILIIGTPITGSWLRKEIYEPWAEGEAEDTECFRFSTAVNEKNLPDGYVEWFSSKLSDKERRIRIEGEFFDLDGLALAHLFKRDKHLLPPDFEWDKSFPCVVAIDPHPSKKHVALLVGADKQGPVVLKELSGKLVPREFARELKKWYASYRVVDIVCDSLGSADSTGGEGFKSFIQVLNEEGIRARATTYDDKNDEDWISRIQEVLAIPTEADNFGNKEPKLRISPRCAGLISDIESVEWVKHRNLDEFKPSLNIGNKDYLACLKYGLATNITYKRSRAEPYYRNGEAYGIKTNNRVKMNIRNKLRPGFTRR